MKTNKILAFATAVIVSASAVGSSPASFAYEDYPADSVTTVSTSKKLSKLDQVITEARKLVGIQGRPNVVTHYWNSPYTDYCAMTVVYVLEKCGIYSGYPRTPYVDRTAEFRGFRDVFEEENRFTYGLNDIQIGYFAVFGKNNYGTHIGIVSDVNYFNHTITVIEGNTQNDAFEEITYSMYDPRIIGYCQMTYSEDDTYDNTTGPAADEIKADTFIVSNFNGAWLRAFYDYGKKIGILSTGTVLYSDRRCGEWVHVLSATIEEASGFYDGWVHISNLSKTNEGHGAVCTTVTATAVTTSTTTTTTVTTTALSETAYSPLVTTFTVNLSPGFKPVKMKIASAIGGKIRSSADLSNDFNVSDILDTDTVFIKTDIVNGFAYGFVEDTGLWGYCHLSILKDFDDTTVSAGAVPTHKVVSDIGCHARKNAYLWSESLMILDTDQLVTVLYPENDFYFCEFTLSDGTAHNAYIHNSVISPLS